MRHQVTATGLPKSLCEEPVHPSEKSDWQNHRIINVKLQSLVQSNKKHTTAVWETVKLRNVSAIICETRGLIGLHFNKSSTDGN